jgi:thiol-disulfide isomerase/thioredoxin
MAIFKTLYNDLIKPLDKYIVSFILIIIFAVAGFFGYKWFIQPTIENLGADDIANDNRRISDAKILFFYADWCPHCKKAKPDWDQFSSDYNNSEVGYYRIVPEQIDCTEGSDPMIQEYAIDGYPTIIMIKDGKRINYDARITYDNLKQFTDEFLH